MKPNASPAEPKVRVNLEIRARQVRVIDEEGEQLGIMAPIDAMREAEQRGLDLVEVAPMGTPPVCRIMDYGKYRYEQKRRQREARKHQHTVVIKEVKYRPKISKHDLDFKNGHVREFLEQGNKVKVTVMFRGREMAHPEFGTEILVKVVESVQDITAGEVSVGNLPIEGRNMSLILAPSKNVMKKLASKPATASAASAAAGGGGSDLVEHAIDEVELVEVAESAEVSEE
jgi:translation initiation factor IF-3